MPRLGIERLARDQNNHLALRGPNYLKLALFTFLRIRRDFSLVSQLQLGQI